MIDFYWEGDEEDATCKHGKYTLRVNSTMEDDYLWKIYEEGTHITFGYAPSMAEALIKAERAVRAL